MKFVIEHMEDDISEWSLLEYRHISQICKDKVMFTNVKKDADKLKGEVKQESVKDHHLKNCCVLDPNAEETLTPDDKFDYFIFGGILGDFPAKKRTAEIKLPCERRNLGEEQMSTDTAVLVTAMIIEGNPLEKINFADELEIKTAEGESVQLPYRYVIIEKKPILPDGLMEYLQEFPGF